MLCAISGEAPEVPVVSKKTGLVYEKRLIEKYIEEHGTEPGTDTELDVDDLLPLKAGRVVRPRPPTLTSIPALLATFQNEWDALALETYTLQEQLAQTRMELATALYQHDAAIRVIARLTKERDEARESLSRVTVTAAATAGGGGGDDMAVDSEELPEALAQEVDETHKKYARSPLLPFPWFGRGNGSLTDSRQRAGSPNHARSAPRPRAGRPPMTSPRLRCSVRTTCA